MPKLVRIKRAIVFENVVDPSSYIDYSNGSERQMSDEEIIAHEASAELGDVIEALSFMEDESKLDLFNIIEIVEE